MSSLSLDSPKATPTRVYTILAIGMLSVSFAPILGRLAQGAGMSSVLIAAARLVIASLVLTPITLTQHWSSIRRLARRDLLLALGAGAFLALHFTTWFASLAYTSVLVSTVLVTSSPIWVAILEYLFLKAKLPRLVMMGLLIAITGALLIGFAGGGTGGGVDGGNNLLGGMLALVGALAVSIYLIIGRELQQNETLPIIPYIWLVYSSAALIMTVVILVLQTPILGFPPMGYVWLLAMAIFPQLIGHSSLNYAMGYLPATIVSMTTQLEPIGSAILAYFIFSELPLPLQLLGSVFVLIGVTVANVGQMKRKQKKTTS
jgi:drug/metabolite transporter (DMT)-like permease